MIFFIGESSGYFVCFFIAKGSGQPSDCFCIRQCFADLEAPKALLFPCPISRKEDGQRIEDMGTMEFLPPHSWVMALEPGGLLQELTCNDKDLKVFWKSQQDSPQMSDKLWSGLDWSHLPIPYVLHGDGAPFTEVDSLQVISFRCLFYQEGNFRKSVDDCSLAKAISHTSYWKSGHGVAGLEL